jgi:hypothetical protein
MLERDDETKAREPLGSPVMRPRRVKTERYAPGQEPGQRLFNVLFSNVVEVENA